MISVQDIMTTDVVTVAPTTGVKELVELLLAWDVNGLPVVDIGDNLVGMVTQADVLTKAGYPGQGMRAAVVLRDADTWEEKADALTAGEIMSADVLTCHPTEDIRRVARRMLHDNLKAMPVVADGRLVGIVSRQDILGTFDRPDAGILGDIERFLAAPLWAPGDQDAKATVDEGVVVLTGTVRYPAYAQVIVDYAGHVRGVVGVVSHLSVEHGEHLVTGHVAS